MRLLFSILRWLSEALSGLKKPQIGRLARRKISCLPVTNPFGFAFIEIDDDMFVVRRILARCSYKRDFRRKFISDSSIFYRRGFRKGDKPHIVACKLKSDTTRAGEPSVDSLEFSLTRWQIERRDRAFSGRVCHNACTKIFSTFAPLVNSSYMYIRVSRAWKRDSRICSCPPRLISFIIYFQ